MRRTKLPLPALPAHVCHSIDNFKDDEAERFLTHACRLDRAWQSPAEQTERWTFNAQDYVSEMVVLPGGRFMVASISDESRRDWRVVVYFMGERRAVAMIQRGTKERAYGLQAKFMEVGGDKCIVVAYTTRVWIEPEQYVR